MLKELQSQKDLTMRQLDEMLKRGLTHLEPAACCTLTNFFATTPTTIEKKDHQFAPHQLIGPNQINPFPHMNSIISQHTYFLFMFTEFMIREREKAIALVDKQKEELLQKAESEAFSLVCLASRAELFAVEKKGFASIQKRFNGATSLLKEKTKRLEEANRPKETNQLEEGWVMVSNDWETVEAIGPSKGV